MISQPFKWQGSSQIAVLSGPSSGVKASEAYSAACEVKADLHDVSWQQCTLLLSGPGNK